MNDVPERVPQVPPDVAALGDSRCDRAGAPDTGCRGGTATSGGTLEQLNALPKEEAVAVLLMCCGSKRWAEKVAARRPFVEPDALLDEAGRIWLGLEKKDWLEAFGHHPRIGERDLAASAAKFGGAEGVAVASKEQLGMASATDDERQEFASGNEEYERKFGFVFLICATGKTAGQMLEQLRARLGNDRSMELANAAREQAMITRLRLERWLTQ